MCPPNSATAIVLCPRNFPDRGPESGKAYDANLAYELKATAAQARKEAMLKNSALMKQWAKEGK